MKIITLTLNPAFDLHCEANDLALYRENILRISSREAGGKGVNISRALDATGIESTAILLVGEENGAEYLKMLEKDGINTQAIQRNGRIRENITVHEPKRAETRLSFGGMEADESVICDMLGLIGEVGEDSIITLTGSLPNGLHSDNVLKALRWLKENGARIVIDSRSVGLRELCDFAPWLIKPNKQEAESYLGCAIDSPRDAIKVACELRAHGLENAMISLGAEGAVLANQDGYYYAKAPYADAVSTIGAGDSMIAGFIAATLDGLSPEGCLSRAVAYGTAACTQIGTMPPTACEIARFEKEISVTKEI